MTLRTEQSDVGDQPVVLDTTGETSPYPFFEYMRRTDPVFHGTFMDIDLLPPELKPDDEYVLFGYDGVFQAFRDDRIFTSAAYDKTIGLVMGHTILAMGGREHHDHRNLVAKAFRATALERWEPSVIGPVCDRLVDEIKNDGHADLVKAVTFEFPTRIISTLLGLLIGRPWAIIPDPVSIFALIPTIATLIDLADVRPAVREVSGGNRW